MANWRYKTAQHFCFGILWWCLLATAAWIYAPGLAGPTLLDDSVNLAPLATLKVEPQYWVDATLGNRSGAFGRPVAMATFVAQYVLGYDDVWYGKYLNLILHLLNASILCWLVYLLVAVLEPHSAAMYAVLGSGTWLLSPLLTSTVLYLIQRMASLCTLWILLGMLLYVKARMSFGLRDIRFTAAILCWCLCLLFAVFTKENGVLLAPMTFAVEWCLLQFKSSSEGDSVIFKKMALGFAGLVASLVIGWLALNYRDISNSFAFRGFTLGERLLTEARILWVSVADYFYPFSRRFGVYHDDIIVSRGLMHPASTFFSVVGWLLAIALACMALATRKLVLPALGALLFLLGHSLESTIFPLELYFEHRNYLAASGLVVFFAGLSNALAKRVALHPGWIAASVLFYIACIQVPLAREVGIWSDRTLFAMSAVNRHPESTRANLEWAKVLAENNELELSMQYVSRSYVSERISSEQRELLLKLSRLMMMCTARKPFAPADIKMLEELWPKWHDYRSTVALEVLVNMGREEGCPARNVLQMSDGFWGLMQAGGPAMFDPRALASLARLEGGLEHYDRALAYARSWALRSPAEPKVWIMIAYFAGSSGKEEDYKQAMDKLLSMEEQEKLSLGDRDSVHALIRRP